MNLDDHKFQKNKDRNCLINWPLSAADDCQKFEEFCATNKIKRSSFVRALIKEFLDKQEDE